MVPDSDMVPIPGMAQSLSTFLARPEQRECQMCAYVVPVYEIKSTIGQAEHYTNYLAYYYMAKQFKINLFKIVSRFLSNQKFCKRNLNICSNFRKIIHGLS